jgi:hypothetical protein
MSISATITALQRAQVSANIEVPAEPIGILDGCNLKFDDKAAALNQNVLVPVVLPQASVAATNSNVPPTGTNPTIINQSVTITDVPEQKAMFTGEQLRLLDTVDSRDEILKQWLAQAQRSHRNEMAAKASLQLQYAGSRAVGKVGSLAFKSDLTGLTKGRRVLVGNGCPKGNIQVGVSLDAYQNMQDLNVIQKAQEAGSDMERRTGVVKSQFGTQAIREDAFITDHTAGAGTGYLVDNSPGPYAIGTTAILLKSGTVNVTGIQIGDVITFAGDPNQYCVTYAPGLSTATVAAQSASNLLATAGTIYIGNPGLRQTLADGVALTIVKSATTTSGVTGYTPSAYMFARHALVGVVRPPVMPQPNAFYNLLDTVTDSYGYTYLFGEANQQFQVTWFLWVAYGFNVTQSEYVVPIIGN